MFGWTCTCMCSHSEGPCISKHHSDEIISKWMALLVNCLFFHVLGCPTERTSAWEEKDSQHLWPATFPKHPLDLCHAVDGVVSPPLSHLTSTFSTLTPHMQMHNLLHACIHTQFHPVHASPRPRRSISLTTNNDLSGAVEPATKIKMRSYVTAQYDYSSSLCLQTDVAWFLFELETAPFSLAWKKTSGVNQSRWISSFFLQLKNSIT